jgi:hypothetical protein
VGGTRFFSKVTEAGAEGPSIMVWLSDRGVEGLWSTPNVPLIVFSEALLPKGATGVTPHGGGVATAAPVQLLFWGGWWATAEGGQRRWMIEDRLQALLASEYLSELAQYGVAPPHFRGSLIVSKPAPPMSFSGDNDHSPGDMIVDLIENDLFPDPDDEPIAYLVLMPKGFSAPGTSNGAHTTDYDYEFPFDFDWFWWGWIRYFDDNEADDTTRTMSHELTELLTNPDTEKGWYADPGDEGEVADIAHDKDKTYQTAWVNGAKVQAYWSNRHSATVIPIDHDYRARIIGSIALQRGGRHQLESGSFRPNPAETVFCKSVPACCFEDRDYSWVVNGLDERATLRVETRRYREPVVSWTIDGQPAKGNGSVSVVVQTARYSGRSVVTAEEAVTVQFSESKGALEIKTNGIDACFDLPVACSVREGSIGGKAKTEPVATPNVMLGFVGCELVLDSAYEHQRGECHKGIRDLFSGAQKKTKFRKPRPGEPVEIDPLVLVEAPAWTRLREFERAREAIELAKMAEMTLSRNAARKFIGSLIAETPALAVSEAQPPTSRRRPARAAR